MVILSLYCNNIFMFHDFYLDFTYERKVNSAFPDNDSLFPESKIKVRKSMVLMGGNAAGKTTFGKLLCAVNNFILGREVTSKYLNLSEVIYDKDKEAREAYDDIINVFSATTDEEDMKALFDDMFTESERRDFVNRWLLMKDIYQGKPQRQIASDRSLSLCKITRGSRMLKKENGFMRRLLASRTVDNSHI